MTGRKDASPLPLPSSPAAARALYRRVVTRLGGDPGKKDPVSTLDWLAREERRELERGRAGSWMFDANRLVALQQAQALARHTQNVADPKPHGE
ncbi:hypothetical protein [Stappia sp.]|uniref:hypothetical protein n=1 Tax=Stappia sp. TaxID=1870903 RepID=UPI003A997908